MATEHRTGWLRKLAIGLGLSGVVAGPVILALIENPHVGWASMVAGLVLIIASRIEDIVEIGFGTFKARLERRVADVEDAMNAVRELARSNARMTLDLVQFSGRFDGFPEEDKERVLENTRSLLIELGVEQQEIDATEVGWHAAVEFDYAIWATGNSRVPKDLDSNHVSDWNALREGGIVGRRTPQDIRAFFQRLEILTPERENILKDYEFYIENRHHRRPEAWRNRRGQ